MVSPNQLLLAIYRRTPRRIRAVVVRSIMPKYTMGVVALLVNEQGQVLFVRLTYRRGWCLPGGLVNRGERPDDAIRREVKEEMGLDIDVRESYRTDVSASRQTVTLMYLATLTERQWQLRSIDRVEIAEAAWFAADDMPSLDPDFPTLCAADRAAVAELIASNSSR